MKIEFAGMRFVNSFDNRDKSEEKLGTWMRRVDARKIHVKCTVKWKYLKNHFV